MLKYDGAIDFHTVYLTIDQRWIKTGTTNQELWKINYDSKDIRHRMEQKKLVEKMYREELEKEDWKNKENVNPTNRRDRREKPTIFELKRLTQPKKMEFMDYKRRIKVIPETNKWTT